MIGFQTDQTNSQTKILKMKLMQIVLSIFIAATVIGCAEAGQKDGEAPQVVLNNFKKAYPEAKKVKWEVEDGNYEAEFKMNKKEMGILYNSNGDVLETEVQIGLDELPATVNEYVAANHPGFKLDEAFKVEKDRVTSYEVEIENDDDAEMELLFDASGNYLGVEEDDEGDKEDED